MSSALQRALSPASLGALELRNRLIKSGTYEGKTPDGIPGQLLKDFHMAIAEGGIGMTTIAYCATEADGRIEDQMMYMHEAIRPNLVSLINDLQSTGARVSGQMAHCGYFSKNRSLQRLKRPQSASRQFNVVGFPAGIPFGDAMTIGDIDYLVQTFHDAAAFMKSVGFDAIEIHAGHGYGISQFISPKTNRRTDEFGGSVRNRMRLPMRVVEAVRKAVGDEIPILVKMNLTDGPRDGLREDEAVVCARYFDQSGADALILSGGSSHHDPMKIFRGPSMVDGLVQNETNLLAKAGMKIAGSAFFKDYPYEELYHRDGYQRVRDVVACQLVYIGGCHTMRSLEQVMQDGIDFVQLGRPLLADPAFANNAKAALEKGTPYAYHCGCTNCNRCVPLVYAPGGCRCIELEEKAIGG